MELLLSPEEAEVVWDILADRHRELLREISHTSHREFKTTLRHREAELDAVVRRLSVLRAKSLHRGFGRLMHAGYPRGNRQRRLPMPVYDYICKKCHREFEKVLTLHEHDDEPVVCPRCGSKEVEQEATAFFAVTSRKS